MSDAELLAVVLGIGGRGQGVLRTAETLLAGYPDLRRMAGAGIAELARVPGVGLAQACRIKAALALAGRLAERPYASGERIGGPREVFQRVGRRLASLESEVFVCLSLDAKHRVIGEHRIAAGGACSVAVLPREAFKYAIRDGAVAVVFVHNHPSGDPAPSTEDREITRRLRAAGEMVGVTVLDHVIVAQLGYHSLAGGRTQLGADL